MTYIAAIIESIREEMERDKKVFLMGQGIQDGGSYRTAVGLCERFGPDRVRDTPVAEDSVIGCAVGAAISGMRPIVEILYCDFLLRAMDQIVNQAAKYRYMAGGNFSVPMVIRSTSGYGGSRAAQHSQSLEATFMHFPGIKIAVPSTPRDVKGLLKSAIRDDNPVMVVDAFQLLRTQGPVPEEEYVIPLGEAEVKKEGKDVTIVALSTMVLEALQAAEELAREGIEAEVLDPRTLVPLDLQAILNSVRKTNRLMVVEAGCRCCGVGSEIVSLVTEEAFDYLDSPPVRLGIPDTPIPFAASMEKFVLPGRKKIIEEVRRLLQ